MQLGFLTAILPDLDLDKVLEIASKIGYQCLEVCCWPPSKAERRYSGITHIDVQQLINSDNGAEKILQRFSEHNISLSGLGYYPNPLSPDAEDAELAISHLRRVIEAAKSLEVYRVNTFVGRDWTKSVEANWPRFMDTWQPLIDHADAHGVKIGIENCPMIFTADEWPGGKNLASSPAIWRRMFEAIPSLNFGLNYDPSHLVWQRMDYIKPIREFSKRIHHVHAKDVRVDQYLLDDVGCLAFPNLYHSPKLPGMGDVDWGKFFSALTDSGYDGPVCVEVEDRAYEGTLDHRVRALHQSYNFLRQYIA